MEGVITEEMLTEGQRTVRDSVRASLAAGDKEIMVGGAAGTGKTTMLKLLADEAARAVGEDGGGVKIAAPTNKAAKVLRSKLPRGYTATTLHYLLGARPVEYMTSDIPDIETRFEKADEGSDEKGYLAKVLGTLRQIFEWEGQAEDLQTAGAYRPADPILENIRRAFDGLREFSLSAAGISETDIVIVDESSMVGDDLRETTVKTGATIIWIGDPYQLEPVKGSCWFAPPAERTLTQVMRQAGDSGILALATMIRNGCADTSLLARSLGDRPDVEWIFPKRGDVVDWSRLADEYGGKWLTWRNGFKTRSHPYHTKRLNDIFRYTLGFEDSTPRPGDRLYILERFTNHCKSVYLTKGDEVRVGRYHGQAKAGGDMTLSDCPAKTQAFDPVPLHPDFEDARKEARRRGENVPAKCVCKHALGEPEFCNGRQPYAFDGLGDHPWNHLFDEAEAHRIDLDIETLGSDWRSVDGVQLDPEAIFWDERQGTRLFKLDQWHRTKDAQRNFSPRQASLKATYAYCGSVHQSQGSEFESVCIFWDPGMIRMNPANAVKFLYTAVTRARSRLCIVTI